MTVSFLLNQHVYGPSGPCILTSSGPCILTICRHNWLLNFAAPISSVKMYLFIARSRLMLSLSLRTILASLRQRTPPSRSSCRKCPRKHQQDAAAVDSSMLSPRIPLRLRWVYQEGCLWVILMGGLYFKQIVFAFARKVKTILLPYTQGRPAIVLAGSLAFSYTACFVYCVQTFSIRLRSAQILILSM